MNITVHDKADVAIEGKFDEESLHDIGDNVTPKTEAGLQLADEPMNGEQSQARSTTCVFTGVGEVLAIHEVLIDYNSWTPAFHGIGKLRYRDCLVRCEAGVGWAGSGALVKSSVPVPPPFPVLVLTGRQSQAVVMLLESLVDQGCSFMSSRPYHDEKCGIDTGKGFDCYVCIAVDLLGELEEQVEEARR